MSTKMWEIVVEHATECVIDDNRLYLYCPQSQKKDGVVFNVVGQVLGLLSDCKYVVSDLLSETEKVSFVLCNSLKTDIEVFFTHLLMNGSILVCFMSLNGQTGIMKRERVKWVETPNY